MASIGFFAQTNAVLLKENEPVTTNLATADSKTGAGANLSSELTNLTKQFAEIEANIKTANEAYQEPPADAAGMMKEGYKFVMGQVTVDGLGQWGTMTGQPGAGVVENKRAAP